MCVLLWACGSAFAFLFCYVRLCSYGCLGVCLFMCWCFVVWSVSVCVFACCMRLVVFVAYRVAWCAWLLRVWWFAVGFDVCVFGGLVGLLVVSWLFGCVVAWLVVG